MNNSFHLFLILCFLSVSNLITGNTMQQDSIYLLRGRIVAADTKEPLANASISVQQMNIASISNQDGYFSIRIPDSTKHSQLIIRYLGYENKEIPIITLIDNPNSQITLTPSWIELSEVVVVSGDGSELIRNALRRIPQNYPERPHMMVAFYRESIKKGSHYISLVETVLDIYKASYSSYSNDQSRIYIGRKATDISPRDTIMLKFQGGISDALLLDIAKNPEIVFGTDASEYKFHIEGLISFNDKPHYIIVFSPLPEVKDILFRGRIYLDSESFAFARMEFNMNVEEEKEAPKIFIKRKPAKMKVDVNKAQYVVDFIENNGKWYFNYSSIEVIFRVRWTNRFFGLFSTTYTIGSEIAITDRYDNKVLKFPRNERIQSTDVIAEKVEHFLDPDFWGEYNVIEPNQEIMDAVKRLSGKLQRRAE
ncbi:carboxypeptidase-like regulatory domain-containing protein [Proteiniphilum sp.]|uniref:carboxypeptidase-like regulatory domain-containing protein n=1 Tax=Proteiniphilum sp. TaxID=1926877 RepID=UPI002B208F7F|nr:carboxypeptidase-like regulatory domain-containing protein [Proteiniphilum sp.]MEA4917053.1 carboxypeptidase-like regulatory domain-containing protein [Proteiniphilum sp.]